MPDKYLLKSTLLRKKREEEHVGHKEDSRVCRNRFTKYCPRSEHGNMVEESHNSDEEISFKKTLECCFKKPTINKSKKNYGESLRSFTKHLSHGKLFFDIFLYHI